MKILSVLIALTFIFSSTLEARSPAVEPVTGISIDQYQEVSPQEDPGFNWKKPTDITSNTSLITTRTPAESALITKTENQTKSWPVILFLLGLICLPFALWYSVMKGLEDKDEFVNQSPIQDISGNTVDLNAERKKRSGEQDKDDISKAS